MFDGVALAITGHGYGHGRGMGQWGAYGYAKQGWSANQILSHFYTGIAFESRGNDDIRARIDTEDTSDTVVSADPSGAGFQVWAAFQVVASSGSSCRTARAVSLGGGAYRVECQPAGGGWQTVRSSVGGPVVFTANQRNSDNFADNLQVTLPEGTRWYRGDVWASFISGRHYTVNVLPLESYLRGVVSQEMPASWGSSGGMEALKAQAIAARTYALDLKASHTPADGYDVCNSTCQSYGGRKLNSTAIEQTLTDQAISATAGSVMTAGGSLILAEYSSSSGGYTASGSSSQTYLRPVVDEGDTVSGNTHHTWSTTVPVVAVEAAYPALGTLDSIEITGRNGYGEWGGRVKSLTLHGLAGNVTLTGSQFRSAFGLQSDWLTITGAADTSSLAEQSGLVGYYQVASDGGIFSFGDAVFFGSTGAMRLNEPVVGMAATPSGGGYWLVASDGGIFSFGDAVFYGSTGAIRLAKPILGMTAAPSGGGYWLVASDGGIFAFGDAVFYGSLGGQALDSEAGAIAVTPSGQGYWIVLNSGSVKTFGDAQSVGDPHGNWIKANGIAPTKTGNGYVVSTEFGLAYSYGDAPDFGDVRDAVRGYAGTVIGLTGVRSG